MKKLSLLGAVMAVMLVPLAFGNTSYAADSICPVGFTGPNSHNVCESTTTYTCVIKDNNVIVLDTNNNQVASTGSASSSDNTGAGSSTTGTSANTNNVTFTTKVTNPSTCSVTAMVAAITPTVTPPAVVAAATPQTPAGGAGAVKPASLANTATVSPAMMITGLIAVLGASVLAARLAVTAYGHFKA